MRKLESWDIDDPTLKEKLTSSHVLQGILEIAEGKIPKCKPSDRLRGWELLGKWRNLGLFRDSVENLNKVENVPDTEEDLDEEFRRIRLRREGREDSNPSAT